MARRRSDPVTWSSSESLSSWVWFGADAPSSVTLPAGMDGARLAFVGAESNADYSVNAGSAQDILDISGTKVTITVPVGGGRVAFQPDALRGQGWIALRSETSLGVAQTQSGARTAAWSRVVD